MTDSRALLGNTAAFLAVLCIVIGQLSVRAIGPGMPPLFLAAMRYGPSVLLALAVILVLAPGLLRIERRDLPFLALLGAIAYTLSPIVVVLGLQRTGASRAALLQAALPIWSVWLAWALADERLTRRQIGGVLLAFAGVAVALSEHGLHWEGTGSPLAGDLLMLLSGVLGALYGVLARRVLRRYTAATVTIHGMVLGTLMLLPASAAETAGGGLPEIDGKTAVLLFLLGASGGGFPFLWTFALTRLTPSRVAVYTNLSPLLTALFSAALLGEQLSPLFGASLLTVLAGVSLVNWPARAKRKPAR